MYVSTVGLLDEPQLLFTVVFMHYGVFNVLHAIFNLTIVHLNILKPTLCPGKHIYLCFSALHDIKNTLIQKLHKLLGSIYCI